MGAWGPCEEGDGDGVDADGVGEDAAAFGAEGGGGDEDDAGSEVAGSLIPDLDPNHVVVDAELEDVAAVVAGVCF